MTPYKWAAAAAAIVTLSTGVMARDWDQAPDPPSFHYGETGDMPIPVQTITLVQLPFDAPSWVPDEETKTRALKHAYELK